MDGGVRRRQFSSRSLLRALWKRKLLTGLVWLAVTAGVVTLVQLLPPIYRAETLIRVESQALAAEASRGNRDAELQVFLNAQRQQVLTQKRLLEIVHKFGLYPNLPQRAGQAEIVEMMRRDISVTLERGWSRGRPGAFRVAYQGSNPALVAKVANQLGVVYLEENSRTGEQHGGASAETLESQVQEARKRLQDQEAKLTEYKLKYSGQLPEQQNALLADIGRLQVQLQGVQDAINRTQQNKALTETMYASAQQSEAALSDIVNRLAANSDEPAGETGERESERLQKRLDALRLRYTEEHPEVRNTRELLAKVREWEQKNSTASQGQGAGKAEAGPAITAKTGTLQQSLLQEQERVKNLQAQRDLAAQQLQALEAERKRVTDQIAWVQGRVAGLPIREQELMALNRDYELSKATYQSFLDRNLASQMERPEKFTILEPARVPTRPVKPNRSLLEALGTVVALLLGVCVGLGSEVRRGVVLGEWEIPQDVAILGRVPAIRDRPPGSQAEGPRRKLLRRRVLVSVALLLVAAALGVGIYFQWRPI